MITGVDRHEGMLELFEATARASGVQVQTVLGRWPEVADEVEPADVAVCHHAIYDVLDIEDFISALTSRARRRVVLEVCATPPDAGVDPLWKVLHGIERLPRMVGDDVQTVLVSMGLAVEREDIVLPARKQAVTPKLVSLVRRRLHVGADRDQEIVEFLNARAPEALPVIALWWAGGA